MEIMEQASFIKKGIGITDSIFVYVGRSSDIEIVKNAISLSINSSLPWLTGYLKERGIKAVVQTTGVFELAKKEKVNG